LILAPFINGYEFFKNTLKDQLMGFISLSPTSHSHAATTYLMIWVYISEEKLSLLYQ